MRAPLRLSQCRTLPLFTPPTPHPRSLSATLGYLQRLDRNPARALELMAVLAHKGESLCSEGYAPDAYCAAVVGAGAFPLVLAAVARARPYAQKKADSDGDLPGGPGAFWEVEPACTGLLTALLFRHWDAVPAESLVGVARLAYDRLVREAEDAEEFAELAASAVQRRLELAGAPSIMPEAAVAGTAKATPAVGQVAPFPAPTHVSV